MITAGSGCGSNSVVMPVGFETLPGLWLILIMIFMLFLPVCYRPQTYYTIMKSCGLRTATNLKTKKHSQINCLLTEATVVQEFISGSW